MIMRYKEDIIFLFHDLSYRGACNDLWNLLDYDYYIVGGSWYQLQGEEYKGKGLFDKPQNYSYMDIQNQMDRKTLIPGIVKANMVCQLDSLLPDVIIKVLRKDYETEDDYLDAIAEKINTNAKYLTILGAYKKEEE